MNNIISYQNFNIEIVFNRRLKHSYIQVKQDGTIKVKTPVKSELFIKKFIDDKKGWIEKQLQKSATAQCFSEELFTLEYIAGRMEYFSNLMDLKYNNLKFKTMKSRWGSCNTQRNITLNTQLRKLNAEMIDYIVVHELAHLVHMNHSKDFHALVENYLPEAKSIRKSMRNIKVV